jgi:hypothetical protein
MGTILGQREIERGDAMPIPLRVQTTRRDREEDRGHKHTRGQWRDEPEAARAHPWPTTSLLTLVHSFVARGGGGGHPSAPRGPDLARNQKNRQLIIIVRRSTSRLVSLVLVHHAVHHTSSLRLRVTRL